MSLAPAADRGRLEKVIGRRAAFDCALDCDLGRFMPQVLERVDAFVLGRTSVGLAQLGVA